MKNIVFILLLCIVSKVNAQLEDKQYESLTQASCAKMVNGGCMKYTYCILNFKENSVSISYEFEANCSPKNKSIKRHKTKEFKTYNYYIINDEIVIKGFNDYGNLQIKDSKLIGKKIINGNETREIIFNQQIKNDTMEYFNENTYKDWEIDNNYSAPYPEMEKFLKRGNEKARITKDDAKIYVTISNTLNPYEQILVYSPKTKICIASYKEFYKNIIGFLTEYNEIGKLIKEIDYDKPYKFSIEDLIKKMKDDYKVDLLDVKHVISLYRYEEKKELNIPLYEIWYNYDDLNRNNVECYLINGTTGETLFTIKRFLGDKKGSLLQNYLDSLKNKQKTTSAIYKTHQSKSYTQAEWEAYEEKQYEEYCKRTGRPYTPKNQLTNPSDRDARKSFIANDFETGDKNIPKKKKGFWG